MDSIDDSTPPIDEEPVRTLFVSGFPLDVKSREVYNLFRFYSGFENSSMSYAGERKLPVAFVVFTDQSSALSARDALQGINFDPDTPSSIRIELARSNSKAKRRRSLEAAAAMEKRRIEPPVNYPSYLQSPLPGLYTESNSNSQRFSFPIPYLNDHMGPFLMRPQHQTSQTPTSLHNTVISPVGFGRNGFPPCSTLFVGNLGPSTNEKELEDLFRSFPGFERLKISRKDHSVMCFAEFKNIQCSTHAMNSLQGVTLKSSDKGGIRIEYARNRMGESLRDTF